MRIELISYTKDVEKYIASAAKLCYSPSGIDEIIDSIDDRREEYYIDMLTEMGHESPIEHSSFTFAIEGVSRSLLAQITRHRIASFTVQSQRYVNMDDFSYVMPPSVANSTEAKNIFLKAMDEDRQTYSQLSAILTRDNFAALCMEKGIDAETAAAEFEIPSDKIFKEIKQKARKAANEDARFILPNACETKIIMTMNARSLYNFFRLRTCMRAQWEIRALAVAMLGKLKEVSPLLFKKAGPPCVCYGFCTEGKMSCGKISEVQDFFRL